MRRHGWLLAALGLLLLAGCGKKGPVQPLLEPLPAAAAGSSVRQSGTTLELLVELPSRNQDGTPLTDLQGVRIYRRELGEPGNCPECEEATQLWRDIDLDFPRQARRDGNRLLVRDEEVLPGPTYRYRVVPYTRSGLNGAEVTLSHAALPAVAAPQNLHAVALDRMVRLAWEPPASLPDGLTLAGYQLYRTEVPGEFGDQPLNLSLLTEPRFDDIGPVNGRTYYYQVRAVAQQEQRRTLSEPSPAMAATPQQEE